MLISLGIKNRATNALNMMQSESQQLIISIPFTILLTFNNNRSIVIPWIFFPFPSVERD
jgi:hypothetical protein